MKAEAARLGLSMAGYLLALRRAYPSLIQEEKEKRANAV